MFKTMQSLFETECTSFVTFNSFLIPRSDNNNYMISLSILFTHLRDYV